MDFVTLPQARGSGNSVSDLDVGRAAEHIVCAELILLGYRAYLSDQGLPYDIVVDLEGRLVRVQVKGTRSLKSVPQRAIHTPAYLFHCKRAGKGGRRLYGADEFDVLALVALDIKVAAYMPVIEVPTQCVNLRPPGYAFRANATRLKNIDEWPFEAALARWLAYKAERGVVIPAGKK